MTHTSAPHTAPQSPSQRLVSRAAATPQQPVAVAALRVRWAAERRALLSDIQAYPAPITACDVQFNTLLLRRGRLARALSQLEALAAAQLDPPVLQAALEALQAQLNAEAQVGHASVFVE